MQFSSDYSFLTLQMCISTNLVPKKYAGQDVRLLYSRSNPAHMGFWFAYSGGHERYYLKLIKEMGFTGEDLRNLPYAYLVEE